MFLFEEPIIKSAEFLGSMVSDTMRTRKAELRKAIPMSSTSHVSTATMKHYVINAALEVEETFSELARNNGPLLQQFQDTFNARKKISEFVESAPPVVGLARVFAGLLRMIPLKTYLEQSLPKGGFNDCKFMEQIQLSLKRLAEVDPQAFEILMGHQHKSGKQLTDILAALLTQYSDSSSVYPY